MWICFQFNSRYQRNAQRNAFQKEKQVVVTEVLVMERLVIKSKMEKGLDWYCPEFKKLYLKVHRKDLKYVIRPEPPPTNSMALGKLLKL